MLRGQLAPEPVFNGLSVSRLRRKLPQEPREAGGQRQAVMRLRHHVPFGTRGSFLPPSAQIPGSDLCCSPARTLVTCQGQRSCQPDAGETHTEGSALWGQSLNMQQGWGRGKARLRERGRANGEEKCPSEAC